ncbi:nitroreductase family protein [Desulfosporosinus fructosivorans]
MKTSDCDNSGGNISAFTDQVIKSDVISQLIALGTKAVTNSGNEAWSFAVITDKSEIKRLSDESKEYLLNNLEKYPYFQHNENRLYSEKYNIFFNAPCLLLIYGDTNSRWNVYNCILAAGNIMQDATEHYLRTCWIGFAEYVCDTAEFKSKYKILDHYKLMCALSVGYPTVQLPSPCCNSGKLLLKDSNLGTNSGLSTYSKCDCF